jgi:hypothetical protein
VMQARQGIDRQRPGSRDLCLPLLYLATSDSVFLKEPMNLSVTVNQIVKSVTRGANKIGTKKKSIIKVSPSQAREWKKLLAMISIQQKNLEVLEKKQDFMGVDSPSQLLGEIQSTRIEIENLTGMLEKIQRITEE